MDIMMQITTHQIKTPLGMIRLYANDQSLIGVFLEQEKKTPFHESLKRAIFEKTTTHRLTKKELSRDQNRMISKIKLDSIHTQGNTNTSAFSEPSSQAEVTINHKIAMETKAANPILSWAEQELLLYFSGKKMNFTVPIALFGTPFQKAVWQELQNIGLGELQSYGEIAKKLSYPQASRAVGAAIGSNPLSIIIPCHRVIGKTGQLTGYAGGLPAKTWLLAHEGHTFPLSQRINTNVESYAA